MVEEAQNLTETLTIRMAPRDLALVKEEAKRREFYGPGPLARMLIMDSLALPTERTLLLETVLRVEYQLGEFLKLLSGESAEDQRPVIEIQQRAEVISGSLLAQFVRRRRAVAEAVGG